MLGSLASTMGMDMKAMAWSKGTCSVCGTLPSVSFLARPVDDPGGFLKNTGGQKFLHCGLCGHDWGFNRHICPVCDNMDKDLQIYMMALDQPGERVDICHKCGLYLTCVDMREREIMPHLDSATVGMMHLDIMAQQKGFLPMSDLPWNRIDV
ncbi:MAG: formate dehydrogenase accessory protein FdhE [Desulfatirhabdiaceae bacterium]